MYYNLEHEEMVKNRGDGYTYLGTYKSKEITIDGKNKKMNKTYIRIKCPYCGKKYDVDIYTFKKGSSCTNCCHEYEKSFAYYIEEELGLDLNDVWDWEENSRRGINPWDITKQSHETVYIWCQDKWYHGSYKTTPHGFYQGNRCTYCVNKKVHPKDSFAQWGIDTFGDDFLEKYWSENNDKTVFEVAPRSHDKYKFKCEKCGEEFERSLSDLNFKNTGVVCRDCNNSELEQLTKDILQQYDIEFERNKTFDGLFGLGNGLLSYDFYIKNKKILIENQGKQHKYFSPGFHKSFADFEKQLEHDNRKRKYAEKYGFKLIEIWYDEIEKIENILVKELNL